MVAYIIADITIHNVDQFMEYVRQVPAFIEKHGGRVVKIETFGPTAERYTARKKKTNVISSIGILERAQKRSKMLSNLNKNVAKSFGTIFKTRSNAINWNSDLFSSRGSSGIWIRCLISKT